MEELERSYCRLEEQCRVSGCSSKRCCALVRRAGRAGEASAPEALSAFCDASWRTVYGFVRAQGYRGADAEDLTQGYFARFVEKDYLEEVRSWRGCVRPFLRVSVRHYLSNERDRQRAAKRGGGRPLVSLDPGGAPLLGPVDTVTPEELLQRRQAREAVERALGRLKEEMERAGQGERLARLMGRLAGDPESFGRIARDWGVGRSAVRVALHRIRRRLAALLREENPVFAHPMPS
ncbi:MAG TPA: sigma-70 family RNA polymerase sigma factor [Vicinamibacteria bacterium]|nr:sigma-70 family RNA polymerase sigma factor [Vicinamibacteria bacterium]